MNGQTAALEQPPAVARPIVRFEELPDPAHIREVAAYLRVSAQLVYLEVSTGRLQAIRLGKEDSKRPVYLIRKSALLAWLEERGGGA